MTLLYETSAVHPLQVEVGELKGKLTEVISNCDALCKRIAAEGPESLRTSVQPFTTSRVESDGGSVERALKIWLSNCLIPFTATFTTSRVESGVGSVDPKQEPWRYDCLIVWSLSQPFVGIQSLLLCCLTLFVHRCFVSMTSCNIMQHRSVLVLGLCAFCFLMRNWFYVLDCTLKFSFSSNSKVGQKRPQTTEELLIRSP